LSYFISILGEVDLILMLLNIWLKQEKTMKKKIHNVLHIAQL